MSNINKLCEKLSAKIESSYESGVTLDEAEKLAAEFLHAQMLLVSHLRDTDLEARMRKSGLKAVRAAVYMDTVSKAEKRPTEAAMDHILNSNELVSREQDRLDASEVSRNELERYYDIFNNAHIYYRGIAKGKFE
jgi:hypothetical protein